MTGSTRQTQADVMNFTRRMEESAFDAYREWPVFLERRRRQLEAILHKSGSSVPGRSDFSDVLAIEGQEEAFE